jgi:hypothetical protein
MDARQSAAVVKVGRFLWHLVQMVAAMAAGMAVYVALSRLVLTPEGYRALQVERPFLWYAGMAAPMTAPMVALMRRHGHGWRQCVEMTVAMLLPPAGLIALVHLGVAADFPGLSARTLPESTHVAMLLGMLLSMLHRHAEYSEARHPRKPATTA